MTRRFQGVLLFLSLCGAAHADDLLVPSQYPNIQAAVDAAMPGDVVVLADGVYTGKLNTNITFKGKAITVRSANGAGKCTIEIAHAANTRGFAFSSGEGAGSVVKGITVHGGNSTTGGGVYILSSSPTIEDCVFSNCWSGLYGAGAYVENSKGATFRNCTFDDGLAGSGAGAYLEGSIAKFDGCTFSSNRVDLFGGAGMYCANKSAATIVSCRFVANDAINAFAGNGVGLLLNGSSGTVVNSLFDGNFGNSFGGAASAASSSTLSMVNCTVVHNVAFSGGALFNGVGSVTTAAGCAFFGNGSNEFAANAVLPEVSYSRTDSGIAGPGNTTLDPMFVGTFSGDYRPSPGSPLIDAGDTSALPAVILKDLNGSTRRTNDPWSFDVGVGPAPVVDMGAFEYQPPACYADCNQDGVLDFFDFLCFQNAFATGQAYGDCNQDGVLDFFDFLCYQNQFAGGCP